MYRFDQSKILRTLNKIFKKQLRKVKVWKKLTYVPKTQQTATNRPLTTNRKISQAFIWEASCLKFCEIFLWKIPLMFIILSLACLLVR